MPKVRKPRRGRGPLPPPGYPGYEPSPPVYPGEEKERESKEYETENPPPYNQAPAPPYQAPPNLAIHNGIYYQSPAQQQNGPSPMERLMIGRLVRMEEVIGRYVNIRPQTAHLARLIQSIYSEYEMLQRDLEAERRNREASGGRIINAHAKKTGAFMRKHRISLAEASRRAAAHSRNAKTKARGRRTASVPRRPKRTRT